MRKREAFVAGDEGPDADDADAGHVLGLPQAVVIAGEDPPLGEVRRAGDDGNPMAEAHPLSAMFERAARRGVDLRREIVREKEDMHPPSPSSARS
jgi:hypothetical protein